MRKPIRPLMLASVLALVATACSAPAADIDTGAPSPSSGLSSPSTEAGQGPSSTEALGNGESQSSTSSSDAPKPPPDGPSAPDFTMALESGGTFTLSDAAKPVYMVFWAEW